MTTRIWVVIACFTLMIGPVDLAGLPTAREQGLVATINGQPVYFEDVERQLKTLHSGQSETQRNAFDLDRLMVKVVNDELLAQEALLLDMDLEEPIPTRLQELREKMARDRLEQEEIWGRVELDDGEVQRAFAEAYQRATFRLLTLAEREEAEQIRKLLDDGADFDTLAAETAAKQEAPRNRLFENIARIEVPKAISEVVFDLEPGQYDGPLSTNLGWSLVRLEELEEASQEKFPQFEPRVREETRFRKADELRKELTQRLRGSFEVAIDRQAADIAYDQMADGRLQPIVEDPEAIIVSAGGRTVAAEEFGEALQHAWRAMRSPDAALASRPIVLDRIISHELMTAEALRRGFGESPEVERAIKSYRTELLIPRYLSQILAPSIKVTSKDKEAYFLAHRENYRQLPKLRIGQITVKGQEEAERIAGLLRQNADFAWLAKTYSVDKYKGQGGDRGWLVPSIALGELQESLATAEPGAILGPYPEQENRFIVYRVAAREDQGYYTLDQVSGNVREAVFDQKFRQVLDDVLVALRERSEIEIYDDALAAMRITGSETGEDSHAQTIPVQD